MKEVWKDIPGYEDLYKVSNKGRVKRLKQSSVHKSRGGGTHIRVYDELILSPGDNGNGYKFLYLSKDGSRVNKYVHGLVLESFLGREPGKECNHKNGIKSDNRLDNLEWVTKSENGKHAYRTGLNRVSEYQKKQISKANRGSGHGASKLTERNIPVIRQMKKQGITNTDIAKKFNVNRETVGCVLRGKTWTHV